MRGTSYKAAIAEFCDGGECDPDGVKERHAEVAAIAERFGREAERVALDINRAYLASWRPSRSRNFNLLDED
jgi:hypothetical protein